MTVCDLALLLGLTLGGQCRPPPDPLPENDPGAWSYTPPAPAAPTLRFPPIIIDRTQKKDDEKEDNDREKEEEAAQAEDKKAEEERKEQERQEEAARAAAPAGPSAEDVERARLKALWQHSYAARAGRSAASSIAVPDAPRAAAPPPGAGSALPKASPPAGVASPLPGVLPLPERYDAPGLVSTRPVDNSRVVAADRYIAGVLETGLNTQLDGSDGVGPVIIQTTRNVYGYHGRNVLIPKGSRLVCSYRSPDKIGASRAPLECTRLLLGDSRAEIWQASAFITDSQGRLGATGAVDHRFLEKYGTAFILAGVSAAVRGAAGVGVDGRVHPEEAAILNAAGEELAKKFGEITASVLEQTVSLAPIMTAAQGTRVVIRPGADWIIAP